MGGGLERINIPEQNRLLYPFNDQYSITNKLVVPGILITIWT
jgi:hypothetical protein